ncbi:MAG: oligosaccharide flippase family protein [Pseudomonadota bacterium]
MRRALLLILSGNALTSILLLVRSLVVARLLTLEDFGIAATFAIVIAIIEMASGLGIQQLIVQDKKGNDPELQAGLQGFNFMRGVGAGLVLFALAAPIAIAMAVEEAIWAYQLLALVPILKGLEHLDIHRLNRDMDFGPLIFSRVAPAVLSVAAIFPLCAVFNDYSAMLYSILLHTVLTVISSHLVANRRFRMRFRRAIMGKSLKFGWPLLINNVLLFLAFQADKVLVGRFLGMETLALFSMGVTLTLTPNLVSNQSIQQFFLPQLSENRDRQLEYEHLAAATIQASLASGLLLMLGMIIIADPLVRLLLGDKYLALIPLLPWLGIWQAMRAFKIGNSVIALSLAQTSNAMWANAVRATFIPLALLILIQGGGVLEVIWIAILAEFAAFSTSLRLLLTRTRLDPLSLNVPLLLSLGTLAAAGPMYVTFTLYYDNTLLGYFMITALVIASLASMREFGQYVALKFLNPAPRAA